MPRDGKPPAFQFYPADFLSDENVALMSLAARGAYITLLSHCWLQGSIPADSDKCWHLCHDPTIEFAAWEDLWCQIEPCFTANGNGRLTHRRLERERAKQIEWREKSAKGGKESGRVRRQKAKGGSRVVQPNANRAVEPNANTSSSSASLSSTTTYPPTPLPPALDAPEFAAKWAEWEGYRREIRKKLTKTSRSRQLAALEKVGVAQAIAALDLSMQNGWTGVFPEKVGKGKAKPARMTAGKEETYGELGFD